MSINRVLMVVAVVSSTAFAGCAQPGLGGANYARVQVRGEQVVRLGVVENVRDVIIDARDTGTGTLAGAAIGGVAGSTLGGGHNANAVGAIAGAVLGGVIGSNIEKNANDRPGIEVTVRLETGKLIAITQQKDEEFRVGDKVRILSGQGATRVSHY